MRNDRDDKYEGDENSEYHFSDDSYEVDAHAAKQQSTGSDVTIEKSSKSKRMYISLGVFLVLVGVVYKMVVPSTSQPSLEINNQTAANAPAANAKNPAMQTAAANQQATTPSNPVIPVQSTPAAQQPAAPSSLQQQQLDAMQKVLQAQQANAAAQNAAQTPAQMPNSATVVAVNNTPTAQQAANNMQQMINQAGAQNTAPTTQQQPAVAAPQQAQMQAPVDQIQPGQSAASQTGINSVPMSSGKLPTTNAVTTTNPPINQSIDASNAVNNAQINNASSSADAETARRMAEFQNQNKNLQDQVQLMNSRMALIESQMNQLVQTLTQQFQGTNVAPSFNQASPPSMQQPAQQQQIPPSSMLNQQPIPDVASPPVRLPYNVQAIIPGRAWLRSNNGDTITVAENDDIKGIGRVTKIDPYDGIVVIDVHGKPVSLSYGNSN